MKPEPTPSSDNLSELDIAVENLIGQESELLAANTLRGLPGVGAVRVIESGIWLEYRPHTIQKEEIISALKSAGFNASVFQDSVSGETGTVNY